MKCILPKSERRGAHFPPCSADANSSRCRARLYYKKLCRVSCVIFQQANTDTVLQPQLLAGVAVISSVLSRPLGCSEERWRWRFLNLCLLWQTGKGMCKSKGCCHSWLKAKQLGTTQQGIWIAHSVIYSGVRLIVKILLKRSKIYAMGGSKCWKCVLCIRS